jgi:hypothetical protein
MRYRALSVTKVGAPGRPIFSADSGWEAPARRERCGLAGESQADAVVEDLLQRSRPVLALPGR